MHTHITPRTQTLIGLYLLTAAFGMHFHLSLPDPMSATLQGSLTSQGSTASQASLSSARPKRVPVLKKMVKKVRKAKARFRTILPRPRARNGSAALLDTSTQATSVSMKSRCGDKLIVKALGEECDDGNTNSKDGCSSTCTLESGWSCDSAQPTHCWYECSDGKIATGVEKCDDGNRAGGDGCSTYCKVEPGYECSGEPSTCTVIPLCGNGTVEQGEECDDGNTVESDGCTSECTVP